VASRLSVACCNPPDHQTFVERGGHCPSFSAVCVNGVHGTAWQRRALHGREDRIAADPVKLPSRCGELAPLRRVEYPLARWPPAEALRRS